MSFDRDSDSSRGALYSAIAVLSLVILAVLIAYVGQLPPEVKRASAPSTECSAERALEHIRQVASTTHPAGSFANDKVRDYILAQLRALGVTAEIQRAVNQDGIGVYHNVLGRIPGTANTKAFAMATHYDSVPYGPGAVDDCGGLGVMLELARALKESPPLKNDILFVFTDAEEFSGGGAHTFCEHPWFNDVGIILNFEARGTSGPSYMFETSNENGWLIREMTKAGVNPRATSIMYDAYDLSPFGSDFSQFKRKGLKGYNIAFVDDFCYYHTRDDHPDIISLNSLQHHADYAAGFTRHFGNMDLSGDLNAPDATYFNTIGSHMVVYPLSWGWPLAIIVIVLYAGLVAFGFSRGHLNMGGLMVGLIGYVVGTVCVVAVVGGLEGLLFIIHGRYLLYSNGTYALGLIGVAIAVAALVCTVFRRYTSVQNLSTAGCVGWIVMLLFLQITVPGGAYLAVWPLVFGMCGIALLFFPKPDHELPRGLVIVTTLFALPGILLFVPTLIGLIDMGTALLTVLVGYMIVLQAVFLTPQLALLETPRRYWLPVTAGSVGLAILVYGVVFNGPNKAKPRFNCLSYGLDQDTGRAYWLSSDEKPDAWLCQFIPEATARAKISEFIPGVEAEYLKATAPIAADMGPRVSIVRNEIVDGKRELALHIDTPDAVSEMRLDVVSPTEVFSANVFGKDVDGAKENWHCRVRIFPREGVDLVLKIDLNAPFRLRIIEKCYGLPEEKLKIPPRPDHLIPEPNTTLDFGRRPLRSNHTFVSKTFDLSQTTL